MNIKNYLFVTNLSYQAAYLADPYEDVKQVEDLNYLDDFSDEKWVLFLKFEIAGMNEFQDKNIDKDGIFFLTYSKLTTNEMRFDGMQGSSIKGPDGEKKYFRMALPHDINIENVENIYIKILYIPDTFDESPKFVDHFFYMLNDSEYELAKLNFPLALLKRGFKNE